MSLLAKAQARRELLPITLSAGEEFVGLVSQKAEAYSQEHDNYAPVIVLENATFETTLTKAKLNKMVKDSGKTLDESDLAFFGWHFAARNVGLVPVGHYVHVKCLGEVKSGSSGRNYVSYQVASSEDGENWSLVRGDWEPAALTGKQLRLPEIGEVQDEEEPF